MTHVPEGLDPTIQSRDIVFEADVQSVTPFLKLATASHNGSGHKTLRRRAEPGARFGPNAVHVLQRRAGLL